MSENIKEIYFERSSQKNKGVYDVYLYNISNNEKTFIMEIDLPLSSSVYGSFNLVSDPIVDMSRIVEGFSDFFYNIFSEYYKTINPYIILENTDQIIDFCSKYIDMKNSSFEGFVNKNKKSKTSIIFEPSECRGLLISSMCFKIYSLINLDERLKFNDYSDKAFKDKVIKKLNISDALSKIYTMISSRVYKNLSLNRSVWNVIKATLIKTPDEHSLKLFSHFFNNLFPLLDPGMNPIAYIVKIADDSLRWLISSVYKNKIIFGPESFVTIDEAYGGNLSKDMVYLFSSNDDLNVYSKKGMEILEEIYKVNSLSENFVELEYILDEIIFLPPATKLILFPTINKTFGIDYKYLEKISPRILILTGVYLYEKTSFREEFPILSNFLCSYSSKENLSSKTLYKCRTIEDIINVPGNVFGLSSTKLKYDVISNICGIIISNRKYLTNIVTRKKLPEYNNRDIEKEVSKFVLSMYCST